MGLRIVYGRAGSGKSTFCFSEISNLINVEKKIFIITPEQFSYTAEKKLMDCIKTDAVLNAEVLTLSRMAYRVLNEVGGITTTTLSKCGMAMIIYQILEKHKKELLYLYKTDENIDIAMNLITELKKHGISQENLQKEFEKIDNKRLKAKLSDIKIIYESFEKQILENYIDEEDLLTILANNIEKTNMINDSVIYIDEFSGFTQQEYDVILKLIQLSKKTTITICTDNLSNPLNPDADIFYSNKKTYQKLDQILKSNKLEINEKIFLDKSYRFKTPELKYLEENIYNFKSTKYLQNVENISLFLAKNQYSEIENVAKQILMLVRNKKFRYKDISVITKNLEEYASLTKVIFANYGIPVFVDEKRDLNQNIIVQYVLSVLEILAKNFDSETVFNYLKIGFSNIGQDDIFKLENYCTKWGIKYNKWKKKFKYGNTEDCERFEPIRVQIIKPLLDLNEKIKKQPTAKNISKCLYDYLNKQKIQEKIIQKIKELEDSGYVEISKEYKSSYEIIIDILDQIVLIFEDDKFSINKYIQLLKVGLKNSGLGKIPGTQDQVVVGDVDRSRSHRVRAVFIIGINDGIFPAINRNEGFLNDTDREQLKEDNMELAKGTLENIYEDNFNIYKAFTTAEEKIFLSYVSADIEGKALRPSVLINKIKRIFPKINTNSDVIQKEYEILNKTITYQELIENIAKLIDDEKIGDIWYEVYCYYKKQNEWTEYLKKDLEAITYTNIPENIDKKQIEKLYGNVLKTSVSRLEQFRKCAFSYYLQYGLRIKEKEEMKIQLMNTGSFMHEVIDEFFVYIRQEKIELSDLLADSFKIQKITNNIVDEKLQLPKNYIFIANAKHIALVKRLKKILAKALKYIIESLVYSDFEVYGTEVGFGEKDKYTPIILELKDGKKVEITGKIDRIDTAISNEGKYLRIIDYKSSAKNIDLDEVYAGLQIQLLTYTDAICKEEDFMPAGILYFELLEKMVTSKKKISEEEIEEEIRKNFRMKGLILADVKVIKMQDKTLESGASKIIPASITKSGEISKRGTSGVNKEEFQILQDYIYKTIKQISKEILQGKIDLNPYNKNGKIPCEYCKYKTICGFDVRNKDNKYNYISSFPKDEVLKKMKLQ